MGIFQIDNILKDRRLSRKDLADKIGLTPTSLYRILSGEQNPKLETILLIARELDVNPGELFADTKSYKEDVFELYNRNEEGGFEYFGKLIKA